MTFTPGYLGPGLPMVSSASQWAISNSFVIYSTSTTWESPGRVVYQPIQVPTTCVATRVWWGNGATTSGGATVEVGVYADAGYRPGAKRVSGSAVQGTASQVQFVDTTDVVLSPGLWWIALMMSSATNTTGIGAASGAVNPAWDAGYRFQEDTANPLPATATPVESSNARWWLFGFSTTTIT